MKKTIRLTESDLAKIVKRIIKEDRERFSVEEFKSNLEDGDSGSWRFENGSLILEVPGEEMEYDLK